MSGRTRIVCVALFCSCTLASHLFGWGTLAHCVIALKSGSPAGPGYHNSPDFFPSKHLGWSNSGVTNEFCWTHEVQRTSLTSPHRAMVPTYYTNGWQELDNSASRHMQILLGGKILPERVTQSMECLRIGWAAHNREDQAGPPLCKAHFGLFPGPSAASELYLWLNHAFAEAYCDHLVFVLVCWLEYTGDTDTAIAAAFDDLGRGTTLPPPYDAVLSASSGDFESDALVCLCMKVFRKKQQTVDTIPALYEGMGVQSMGGVRDSREQEIKLSLQDLIVNRLDRATFYRAVEWAFGNPQYLDYWNAAIAAGAGN